MKSINELFIERKNQSSLNHFFTEPKWNIDEAVREGKALLMETGRLNELVEYKVIDDTVCRKYSPRRDDLLQSFTSTMGTVLSHDYVTSLYVNDDLALPDGLKLYGNEKKCREEEIKFKTKVQLACEMIDEHISKAKRTILLWDSWLTCHDTVARCGLKDTTG